MTGSALQAMDVELRAEPDLSRMGRGSGGGVAARLGLGGGWRMTGSAQTRSEAVRLYLLLGEKKKERVWERKG